MPSSQDLIQELHAKGWSNEAIARAVNRDSSLISQVERGKKPGLNLQPALQAIIRADVPSPRVAREAPRLAREAGIEAPERRRTRAGIAARVRTVDTATHMQRLGAERLPNNQIIADIGTKADADEAASLIHSLGPQARFKMNIRDADGNWHRIGQKGGIRPDVLQAYLDAYGSFIDAMAALLARYYQGADFALDEEGLEVELVANEKSW